MALLNSEAAVEALQGKLAALKELDVPFKVLTPEQARGLESGLDPQFPIHTAIHFPQDETANARQFAHHLKDHAQALGVRFHFDALITHIKPGSAPDLVFTDGGAEKFDHIVICTGAATQLEGLPTHRSPLTVVYSYSISLPVREALNAPSAAVLDYQTAIQVVRLGNRIRVSGAGELGARPAAVTPASTRPLFHALQTMFPGGAKFQQGITVGVWPVAARGY